MTTDQLILAGAGVFFVACLLYALRGSKTPRLEAFTAPLRPTNPMRQAFDQVEEEARNQACALILEQMAKSYAEAHRERIQGALAPKATPPNAPSSG